MITDKTDIQNIISLLSAISYLPIDWYQENSQGACKEVMVALEKIKNRISFVDIQKEENYCNDVITMAENF